MVKDRAIKLIRSTAIGITALWISHNYTQPAVDKWRGRDGTSSPTIEDYNPAPTKSTPKIQEPKLVYDHGTWPLLSIVSRLLHQLQLLQPTDIVLRNYWNSDSSSTSNSFDLA